MENILRELFKSYAGFLPVAMEPLGASGSNRKYYRIYLYGKSADNTGFASGGPAVDGRIDDAEAGLPETVIGVIGTDPDENRTFCTLARHFASKGINVPEIYAVSEDWMCYLQQDLGTASLFDSVAAGRAEAVEAFRGNASGAHGRTSVEAYSGEERALLLKTVSMLPKIQLEGAEGLDFSVCHPQAELDGRSIMFDLNYFKYCFLKATGVEFNAMLLEDDFGKLRDDILSAGGNAFLYRDFQSRNVMLVDGEPYFIDFQGGMRGPLYYDLASFVWQAKACYPDGLRQEMVSAYIDSLKEYMPVDETEFRRRLSLFVLFRTLQVLGAYGFRGLFERKQHFIDSIPFALANIAAVIPEFAGRYPYLCSVLDKVAALQMGAMARTCTAESGRCLEMEVYSFSYKKGIPEDRSGNGGGYVFDCRSIHNPGRYPEYRDLTGMDADVIRFLEEDGEVYGYLEHVYGVVDPHVETFLRRGFTHLMASFGCTGGQHRSVYCAEHLAAHLREKYASQIASGDMRVVLIHREQGIRK